MIYVLNHVFRDVSECVLKSLGMSVVDFRGDPEHFGAVGTFVDMIRIREKYESLRSCHDTEWHPEKKIREA
jgi:hypothetical protein